MISYLQKIKVAELIIVGLATDACVSASAKEAIELGYAVCVASDACATFDRHTDDGCLLPASSVHEAELGILQAGGIRICATSDVLKRMQSS